MSGMADWQVQITIDVDDLKKRIKAAEGELDGLVEKDYKVKLDLDTKTLESAVKKLDKMLDSIGKGSSDFKQFENLSKQLSSITTDIGKISKAFAMMDDGSGLVNNIKSIDASLTNLTNHFVSQVSDKMTSSIKEVKGTLSDVGNGKELTPLLDTIGRIESAIDKLSSSFKGIGLNMNIDFGSDKEMEAKAEAKISNALQAYQRLFDHIKFSSAGGSIINTKFFDFDINQYDTAMSKLQAYRKFIENMRNEAKSMYGGQDVLYTDTEKKYWTQASSAMGQVTKTFNEMKAASDTNPLENIFGKTDLTEVLNQLTAIVSKLDEISVSANKFSDVFKGGLNVNTSVEEIDKLTNRVKELESELAKVKTVGGVESNISLDNNPKKDAIQTDAQTDIKSEATAMEQVEKATDEAVQAKKDFVTANEGVQDSVADSKSPLQLEAELMEQIAKSAREAADAKKEFVEANKLVEKSANDSNSGFKSGHSENAEPANVRKYKRKDNATPAKDTGNHDNEVVVNNKKELGKVLKQLQSEIIASIDESTSFVKEVTDFYDSQDNLVKTQMKIGDNNGSMSTYTTSYSKDKDGNTTAWTSHIETQKIAEQAKQQAKEQLEVDKQLAKEEENLAKAQQKKAQAFLKEQANYEEEQKKAEFIKKQTAAYDELTNTISKYSEVAKRVASGKAEDGDLELMMKLEDKISQLQKQSILSDSQVAKSEKMLVSLYDQLDKIEKKTTETTIKSEWDKSVQAIRDYMDAVTKLNNLQAKDKGSGKYSSQIELQIKNIKELKQSAYEARKVIVSFMSGEKINNIPVESWGDFVDVIKMLGQASKGSAESIAKLEDALKYAEIQTEKAQQSMLNAYDNRLESYNKKTSGYDATIKRFEDGGWTSDTYVQRVNAIRDAVEEYQNILNNLKVHPELVTEKELNRLDEQDKLIKENITAIQNMSAAEKGFTLLSGQKAMDKINSILKENSAMSREAKAQIRAWYNEIKSGNPTKDLSQILGEVQKIVNAEADAGRTGKSMLDSIKEKAWYGVASAIGTYFGFNDILRYGGEVLKTVRELDTAYTEMRKVTDESAQSLKNFQKESFSTADSVGTTALALQDATATWMRLGESLDQAKESAKDATVLLNVSEFENIDEATDSLVAMSQAYKELDKMEIIDVLDKIGNEYSISTDQLSTALKDSAAVLKTQGNDLAESVALITAGNAITQDASKTAGETLPEKYRNIFYRTYLTARAA